MRPLSVVCQERWNQFCSKMLFRWRWIFPSRWLSFAKPYVDLPAAWNLPAALFTLVYPDDCRVCGSPLREISSIPVCQQCLTPPDPLLSEYFCVQCQAPFLNSSPLDDTGRCALCRLGLAGFDRAFSFGAFEGKLRKLILLFKYSGMKPLAKPLGQMMNSALPRDQRYDMVVPLPLHWRKRWKRGFNQSEMLSRVLPRRIGCDVVQALSRNRATPPQTGLTNAQARDNVAGAFEVSRRHNVKGQHVLLVDDVLTTGATVSAAARALKRSGADRVTVLTLARADRRTTSFLTGFTPGDRPKKGSKVDGKFGSIA